MFLILFCRRCRRCCVQNLPTPATTAQAAAAAQPLLNAPAAEPAASAECQANVVAAEPAAMAECPANEEAAAAAACSELDNAIPDLEAQAPENLDRINETFPLLSPLSTSSEPRNYGSKATKPFLKSHSF